MRYNIFPAALTLNIEKAVIWRTIFLKRQNWKEFSLGAEPAAEPEARLKKGEEK